MTPVKGYSEMKDSGIPWIGQIPSHWKLGKVKNAYTSTKTIVGNYVDSYERLALTLDGVIKRSKNDDNGLQPEKFDTYQILRKNELVFKLIDLQNVSTSRVGRSPYTGIVSPAYIVLHAKLDDSTKYGEFYFLSMWMHQIFNQLGADGVRSNIGTSALLNLPYLIVPEEEQSVIAAYLDEKCSKIDEIIASAKASIEDYKQWKASIIYEAVTKGLDPNVEMKKCFLKVVDTIPSYWNIKSIKYLATCNDDSLTDNTDSQFSFDYIDISSVKYGEGITQRQHMKFEEAPSRARRIVKESDILVSCVRTYLKAIAIMSGFNTPQIASTGFAVLRAKGIIPRFLYYSLMSDNFISEVEANSVGISYPSINTNKLLSIKIPVPPKDEQEKIIFYLDNKCSVIDSLIKEKETLIADLELYKKSLIYEVVTGKRKVC